MTGPQIIIAAILTGMVVLFIWGRWRHDFVAVAALLACVLAGLVPASDAFHGFGHPAVVTVAGVLILSGALQSTGAAASLARLVLPDTENMLATLAALTLLAAVLSAFMNNVGALALLMPVALQIAARRKLPAGRLLMPLAFGSILGGTTTLIGTPPNLIVSGFRGQTGAGTFTMFDFSPVGIVVTLAGLAFIVLFGWRLVPVRSGAGAESFDTGTYLTEARVPEKSKADGKTLAEVEEALDEADAQIVGLLRDEVRIPAPGPARRIRAGDILVIEAEPDALAEALSVLGLQLEEDVRRRDGDAGKKDAAAQSGKDGDAGGETDEEAGDGESAVKSGDVTLMEVALLPGSMLAGRSVTDIRLRARLGINLLAVSRQGRREHTRLRSMALREGDVLLLQGDEGALAEFAAQYGGVPLADRPLQIPRKREAMLAGAAMLVGVVPAAFGLVPAALSFAGAALLTVLLKLLPARRFYESVDWSVVVLLGALIPVAQALDATGTAGLLADFLVDRVAAGQAVVALALILVATMTLSDFMNNAATAAVMCTIAIGTAGSLGVSADPFLMAVAVGASCALLAPIAHQNNTLILGPGGFRFGDYWRLGLPLEIVIVAVSLPAILMVWPL